MQETLKVIISIKCCVWNCEILNSWNRMYNIFFFFKLHSSILWLGHPKVFLGQCRDIVSPPSPWSDLWPSLRRTCWAFLKDVWNTSAGSFLRKGASIFQVPYNQVWQYWKWDCESLVSVELHGLFFSSCSCRGEIVLVEVFEPDGPPERIVSKSVSQGWETLVTISPAHLWCPNPGLMAACGW